MDWIDELFDDVEDKVQLEPMQIFLIQERIIKSTISEEEKTMLLDEVEEPLTRERLNEINKRIDASSIHDNGVPYRQKDISKQLRWIQEEYKNQRK